MPDTACPVNQISGEIPEIRPPGEGFGRCRRYNSKPRIRVTKALREAHSRKPTLVGRLREKGL
jgi:hypothetical protein